MQRKKLLTIIIVSFCSISGLLYAGYEFIYKKSITSINSDITAIPLDEIGSLDTDIAQNAVYGSQRISFNTYINDEGISTIFVDNKESETVQNEIINQLYNTEIGAGKQHEIKVKVASSAVESDNIIIKNGAPLKDLIIGSNLDTVVEGHDLRIYANKTQDNRDHTSILLIKNTIDKNYIVENRDDRFSDGIFMIPRKQYTAFKLRWQNNLSYNTLSHQADNTTYMLEGSYARNNEGTPVAIPANKKMIYSIPYLYNTQPAVYLLGEGTVGSSTAHAGLKKSIEENLNPGAIGVATNTLGDRSITEFKKLDMGENNEYEFTTLNNQKQGILVVTRAHAKYIPIQTDIAFTPMLQDASNAYEPYKIKVASSYDIKMDAFGKELEKILGMGTYSLEGNNTFSYKIQPKQRYEGNIIIENIFGQKATVPLKLYIENINPRAITKHILSNNAISILPNNGSFQDVLIQHENIGEFPVEFQSCTFKNRPIGSDKTQGLENHLFECSGKKYIQTITTNDFRYWKAYRTPVKMPDGMPKTNAFKVSIPNSNTDFGHNTEHIFVASDVGIWSKISEGQVRVRGFTFSDNKPITDGTITLFDMNGKQITSTSIKQGPTSLPIPEDNKANPMIVTLSSSKGDAFIIIKADGGSYRWNQGIGSFTISSFLEPSDVVSNNSPISFRGDTKTTKIFGYTDKGLYKAGETIYFAGFIRDLRTFDSLDYLKNTTVSVDIKDTQGNMIYTNASIPVDEFGGFKGSAPIPTALSLGDALITYTFNKGEGVSYTHNLKIKEYQKPTFFADISYENKDNMTSLVVKPQYFFGQALEGYDINVSRSVAGKDSCAYCRWWNEESFYYNFVFNDTISTGGQFELYNQNSAATKQLFAANLLQQKGYSYTLKADVIIRDNKSDEVQFFTKYIDFAPQVKLGLSGQPYEWYYNDGSKDPTKERIDGEVAGATDNVKKVQYEIYYRSYDNQQTQQGVDGSTYYVNGYDYKRIVSQDITNKKSFSIPMDFLKQGGSYLVRVFATDSSDTIIGEVQKQISYYKLLDSDNGLMGAVPNNYTLAVSIPKKTYNEGEKVPVDIVPYQKGAHVIMTIERGNRILETIETTLDGSQLSFTAKKGFAPNVVVNVMQIIGTDKSQGPRKEPRFYVGFGQADINTDMHKINIDIKTDKTTYQPGEQVKLTIKTTDTKGNPVDTRLSVGVVDQALLQLYDIVKEPIPYFFNKMGTSVFNFTNMKLLYQSLRAFANNGSKGGGGNGGNAMFSMIRDELEDVAFRRGGEFTKNGVLELNFTLPDNVTTWVVDVIGITKDTRLGTQRLPFIAAKDFIIEPNPPQFVTIGDAIQVPVKMIVAPHVFQKNIQLVGNAYITNDGGDKIDLGKFKAPGNSKVLIPIQIPHNWHDSNAITLHIAGTYKNATDNIAYTIPLRTEGLRMKDSVGVINTAGDHSFAYPENYGSTISLSLGLLPTNLIDPLVRGAIYYPFGCTEQLLSRVLAVKAAFDLQQQGGFTSTLIQGNTLLTDQGSQDIPTIINDAITTLLSRQQPDGSFGRRHSEQTEHSTRKYTLTAYTYGSLHMLKSLASAPGQVEGQLKKAEEYLRKYRTTSPVAYMRYLTQKVQAGIQLSNAETNELQATNPLKIPFGGLMRYVIAVYQNDNPGMLKRKQFATIPTNQNRSDTSQFINQTSAYALKMNAIFKDPTSTQDERMQALQNLLSSRNKAGDRGSTHNNAQALKAIMSLTKDNRPTKESVQCTITVNDKQQSVTISRAAPSLVVEKHSGTLATIKRQCDSTVIADATVTYMPKQLQDQLGTAQGVTMMNYSIENPQTPVGGVTTMIGSWTNTIAGEQVAVSIFLPSTYKIVDTISSMNTQSANERGITQLPFDMSDAGCMPDHWETRFDRLFLYYDSLVPTTCDISIPVIRAYNGSTTIMPMTIQEMYRGKVNGRKVILQ